MTLINYYSKMKLICLSNDNIMYNDLTLNTHIHVHFSTNTSVVLSKLLTAGLLLFLRWGAASLT